MSAALLLELALKSCVVSGVTLLLLQLLEARSAAQRSWLAHAGLALLLVVPAASLVLPSWRLKIPADIAPLTESGSAWAGGSEQPSAVSPVLQGADWSTLLVAAYVAGAGLLLLLVTISVLRLFALRARSAVLVDANWLTALAQAQRRMGVKYGAALLVNDEVRSPLSWGLWRPTILLNAGVVPLHADAEAIIAHELAHVARLDWVKLLASRVATALFWFNPLVWILARQCHQLREEAADDAVLRSDVLGVDYATLLINAARHECGSVLLAAHGVAPSRGSLKQRITRVLDEDMPRAPVAVAWAVGCLFGGLLLAGPLSALTFQSRKDIPSQAPDRAAAKPALLATAHETGSGSAPSSPPGSLKQSRTAAAAVAPFAPKRRPIEDGKSPPFDPLAPDFGDRIANLTAGTADTRKLPLPPESEFAAAGYPGLHQRQKTVLTAMGVTPTFMRDMAAAGYENLSVEDLVDLRRSGVSADVVRKAQRPGEPPPTPAELVASRER